MAPTSQQKELITSLVQDAYRTEHAEHAEELTSTHLWKDLALIAEYANGEPHPLTDVRKALHRIYQHLDPERGLVWSPVANQTPLSESTYTASASTPFVLALSQYQAPRDLHETPLGMLVHEALYNMMGIEEVLTPSETAVALDLGRQRVYELARDGQLFSLYKHTTTGKRTMTALYLTAQVDKIREELEARYLGRSRPGPTRGSHRKKKSTQTAAGSASTNSSPS